MTDTTARLTAAKAYIAERGLDGRNRAVKGSAVLASFKGPEAQRLAALPQRRAFEAAAFTRLTAGWITSSNTLDADLRAGLDTMRARSREMCQNNEYAVRFLAMVRANVIGPQGFRLQRQLPAGHVFFLGFPAEAVLDLFPLPDLPVLLPEPARGFLLQGPLALEGGLPGFGLGKFEFLAHQSREVGGHVLDEVAQ